MDEKVIELLGKVVEQNAVVIRQNAELLAFLEKRDAGVPELVALRIESQKLELEAAKQKTNQTRLEHAALVSRPTS
jgi:hypothetical protein